MAKRWSVVALGFGLTVAAAASPVQAGPIGRKLQEWAQGQPQVYTAQPSVTKQVDLNLTQTSFTDRVRQRLPWRRSKTMTSGYQIKTEYMKHRADGTLLH